MSSNAVAFTGFVVLFVLMLLRVPVGMAMGLVGVTGFGYIVGGGPALKIVGHTSMRTVTDWNFAVVPLFLLMGSFATTSGMSRELFRAANGFLGHFRGGLGIATIAACGGFAAICGSSVATAATFSRVAYPEMRRYGYPQSFATGVIAAGGTLGIMIPPSTVFAVYGLITEQDVGKLFIAGILPGLLAVTMYILTINLIALARPGYLPAGPRVAWPERLDGLRNVWATLLLFVFVIGGIYGGIFTATEAAGMGAGGAFLIGILLILVFAVQLGWLPSYGRGDAVQLGWWSTSFLTTTGWKHLILPSITLALIQLTLIMRLVRSEMLEVLRTDYIKFARARGLTDRAVHFGHALKNTLVPVITITGLQLGEIIAFAIVTETVFQWPGMGLLFIQSVQFADIPVMAAYLLLVGLVFVLINLTVDLLYFGVDPRLRIDRTAAAH